MSGPNLAGKVAVVTGATRGIGRAIADKLAQEGATVVVSSRDQAACVQVAGAICAAGGAARAARADVTDEVSVRQLYATCMAEYGQIDICVNNAGAIVSGDQGVSDTSPDTWRRALEINLTGTFLCLHHQLPHMMEGQGGAIVNISGTAALLGSATPQVGYDAAKAGVLALTRDVAVAHAKDRIRCNAVCAGPITGALIERLVQPEAMADRLQHIPAGRFGSPEDVAAAVVFLAAPSAAWITGVSLLVDGGITSAYNTVPGAL